MSFFLSVDVWFDRSSTRYLINFFSLFSVGMIFKKKSIRESEHIHNQEGLWYGGTEAGKGTQETKISHQPARQKSISGLSRKTQQGRPAAPPPLSTASPGD